MLWSAGADRQARPGKREARLSPVIVAALHWSATAVAAKSASETDADANTDAFHNGARGRTGRTTLNDHFLGRRAALRLGRSKPLLPRITTPVAPAQVH